MFFLTYLNFSCIFQLGLQIGYLNRKASIIFLYPKQKNDLQSSKTEATTNFDFALFVKSICSCVSLSISVFRFRNDDASVSWLTLDVSNSRRNLLVSASNRRTASFDNAFWLSNSSQRLCNSSTSLVKSVRCFSALILTFRSLSNSSSSSSILA